MKKLIALVMLVSLTSCGVSVSEDWANISAGGEDIIIEKWSWEVIESDLDVE